MNLYLRLIRLLLLLPFVRRRDALAESRLSFRVWPPDCDVNLHMNNGRYLALMDLGRVHLLAQMGLLKHMMRRRWTPVLSAVEINFIRPLGPFQKFDLVTRLLTWEEKYAYLEHRFERGEELCAIATSRGVFLSGGQTTSTGEILRTLGITLTPPPMPAVVEHWKELSALKKAQSARDY